MLGPRIARVKKSACLPAGRPWGAKDSVQRTRRYWKILDKKKCMPRKHATKAKGVARPAITSFDLGQNAFGSGYNIFQPMGGMLLHNNLQLMAAPNVDYRTAMQAGWQQEVVEREPDLIDEGWFSLHYKLVRTGM